MPYMHCPGCGCYYNDRTTCPDCGYQLQSIRKMTFGLIFGLVLVVTVVTLLVLPQVLNRSN
jgi:hypothetical protein